MLDTDCYCMRCKQITPTGQTQVVNSGARSRLTGICCRCGTKKSKFLSEKSPQSGGMLGSPYMNPAYMMMSPAKAMGMSLLTDMALPIIGQVIANKANGGGVKKRGKGTVNYVKGWSGSKAAYDQKIKNLIDSQQ